MEALVDRLEQAVNRLEVVSDKLQGCSGSLSNGEMNGYHGKIMSLHYVYYILLHNIMLVGSLIQKCFFQESHKKVCFRFLQIVFKISSH